MDGGWILAETLGTMVIMVPKDGIIVKYFFSIIIGSSLPNTLNYVYGFLIPNSSISDQVWQFNLAPEQTLQRSLLDLRNPPVKMIQKLPMNIIMLIIR